MSNWNDHAHHNGYHAAGSGGRRERKVTIDGERTLTITEETFLRSDSSTAR